MFWSGEADPKTLLQGAVVILPAVAIGNVGQLAADVLISSMLTQQPQQATSPATGTRLVGRLEDDSVLPVVGADAYSLQQPGTLCTALELFQLLPASPSGPTGNSGGVFVLQQRAPARKGCQQLLASRLAEWLSTAGVARVVVLCGLEDATLRKDQQIMADTNFRYWAGEGQVNPTCESLGRQRLEQDLVAEEQQLHHLLPPWPFEDAATAKGLSTLMLSVFVSEGDNQPDGVLLATRTFQWLHSSGYLQAAGAAQQMPSAGHAVALPVPVVTPCSWAGAYGPGLVQAM